MIIGLSGKAGSGKDYIAKIIVEEFNEPIHNVSFAWHLKVEMVCRGLITYDDAFHLKDLRTRKMMQWYGTEMGRDQIHPDVWINATNAWIDIYRNEWGIEHFIIPDVRFVNEFNYIKNKNGKMYKVVSDVTKTEMDEDTRSHRTETELDSIENSEYDRIIFNYREKRWPKLDLNSQIQIIKEEILNAEVV